MPTTGTGGTMTDTDRQETDGSPQPVFLQNRFCIRINLPARNIEMRLIAFAAIEPCVC